MEGKGAYKPWDAPQEEALNMKILRILWLNHCDPKHPSVKGAELHLWEIAKRLTMWKHKVKDKTLEIVDKLAGKHSYVKALHFPKRMGKGFGIKRCFEATKGNVIVMIDLDIEYRLRGYLTYWIRSTASTSRGSST